ncbi:unnamed protein product [Aphanomyces euteiches]|uniref:Uncharacterized protein n=1 Tax=Aphanomyces euteiches TaxID=100861 RepID=A0A6G0W9G1_9STRA|nr:hypothetical protein Ae201684_018100 [Aphanomyces euteiches]KAH9153334.1 hypothetical protein AeRB84_004405 [Aphanomyces euteiches]
MERGSYFQEFMRSKAMANASSGKQAVEETKKLLTDRGAYISFLEIQLERVSAACLHTQSLESQIQDMHVQLEATDAKIATVTKLLKMHQQHTGDLLQSNAQDIGSIHEVLDTMRDTLTTHGTQLRRLDSHQNDVDDAVQTIETKLRSEINTAQLSAESAQETMDLHIQRYHTLFESQKAKWEAMQNAHDDLVRDVSLTESRSQAHADTAIQHLRDELLMVTSSIEATLVEHVEKAKRSRQSMEQYCAVEIARAVCGVDTKLESIDQNATLLQDQLNRQQAKLQQIGQKHHDDCRLLQATIMSLQTDFEEISHPTRRSKGTPPASSAYTESRVLQLERDYKVCREGLEYLRHVMETFEAAQITLTEEWNTKLSYLEGRKQNNDVETLTELEARLKEEWSSKEESWWKAVAAIELQIPALRERIEKAQEEFPSESTIRVQKLEKKMHRLNDNMQNLYKLVEMTIPQKDKAFAKFRDDLLNELTLVRAALRQVMTQVGPLETASSLRKKPSKVDPKRSTGSPPHGPKAK